MTATTPAVPSSEELALELRRWCVKRQFTQHEEQMFADVIAALRAPAGNDGPVLPRKISAEIACILEDCDGPEKQKPEVVAALIDEYQPLWNKLRAALPQREAGEPDRQRIHNMRVSLSGIATLAESAPIEFKTLKAIAKWARESLERDGGETGQ